MAEVDLGISDLRTGRGLLWALSSGYYEGRHDVVAFGPKIGTYIDRDLLPLQVHLTGETGPVLIRGPDGGWYSGAKVSIGTMSILQQDVFFPFSLSLQAQFGHRSGTPDWNGRRLGVAILGGFVFP